MIRSSVSLLIVTLVVLTANATTLLVPSEYPTIQAGINASSSGDTVLVAAGTYTDVGNKNLDFSGRAIVVMSEIGPENTIIDCQTSGRGAYFHSGETNSAVLYGFTINNGSSTNGGGINCTDASPTIERCIILNSQSFGSNGGGIYISNGNPQIIHNTIVSNTATNGGAIYSTNASPVINSNIISGNSASG